MKTFLLLNVIALSLTFSGCSSTHPIHEVAVPSVRNNVCKKLSGKVVLYAIFVDSKYTKPWSEYDIQSTLDSIHTALEWVEQKSMVDSVYLTLKLDYHQTANGRIPIKNKFTKKTLSATLGRKPVSAGVRDVYRWADKIAAEAGKSLPRDTGKVTNIKNDLKDRERLVARLRDIHKTDKVALVYFINNYYTDEMSVAFDIASDNNVEFAIVSYKYPSVIAHEFLHLFGAYDFYQTPFDDGRKQKKRKSKLMALFPDEIMGYAYRDIRQLNLSPITKYLIGWEKELSVEHQDILFDKKFYTIKY